MVKNEYYQCEYCIRLFKKDEIVTVHTIRGEEIVCKECIEDIKKISKELRQTQKEKNMRKSSRKTIGFP